MLEVNICKQPNKPIKTSHTTVVKGTEGNNEENAGLLRIKFTDDENLKEIDQTFFKAFGEKNIRFLYQNETKEHSSRFFKFVSE